MGSEAPCKIELETVSASRDSGVGAGPGDGVVEGGGHVRPPGAGSPGVAGAGGAARTAGGPRTAQSIERRARGTGLALAVGARFHFTTCALRTRYFAAWTSYRWRR